MKTKVAYLIPTLGTGGAEKQLIRTVNLLDQNRYQVAIFVLTDVGDLESELKAHVEVVYLGITSYANPVSFWKFLSTVRAFSPDILHSVMYVANLFSRVYKIFTPRVKVINHVHGLGSWIKAYHIVLDRGLLPFVDKIVLVSQKSLSLRSVRENYPTGKMQVIYNCVDTDSYSLAAKEKNTCVVIGVACRLIAMKNVDFAIRVTEQLVQRAFNVKLKIAGDGPEYTALERLVGEMGLNESVELMGLVSDMPTFYSNIDCFMLCSSLEDLPLTIVEALSCGKPFISSNVGGISELAIQTDSLLYEADDTPQEVASKIESFLFAADNTICEDRNRAYALKNFSEEIHKREVGALYSTLLSSSKTI